MTENNTYGLLIEFTKPDDLIRATQAVFNSGFRNFDVFSPFPIEDLEEFLPPRPERVAAMTFIGGVLGGLTGFGMQWYANVIDYPLNIGGKPDFSWPSFIPVTFELTVLGAALFSAAAMLVWNRLPCLYHPVFNSPAFKRASQDRFFICVRTSDLFYNYKNIQVVTQDFAPLSLKEVPIEES